VKFGTRVPLSAADRHAVNDIAGRLRLRPARDSIESAWDLRPD